MVGPSRAGAVFWLSLNPLRLRMLLAVKQLPGKCQLSGDESYGHVVHIPFSRTTV